MTFTKVHELNFTQGLQKSISLGNLDSTRDWGHAKDYVEGMWLMLQAEKPNDFVLATGKTISVRTMVEEAFRYSTCAT